MGALLPHYQSASAVLDRLGVERGDVVLDVGCGESPHSRLVVEWAPLLVVGLDIDVEALLRQRQQVGKIPSFVCGDALRLPFRDASFDRVICSLVLYLLPMEGALGEIRRVLRPGARAYLRVPMLAWARAADVLLRRPGLRPFAYGISHVLGGACFGLLGRQLRNPLLRHDQWACYVPRRRFEEAVIRSGLQLDTLRVDYPRPGIPSIDAWVSKP